LKKIEIYTDGACSKNPGPGGWAAVILYNELEKEIFGYSEMTTNQRMELTAAIMALQELRYPCDVYLYSDSAYLVNCFLQKWYVNWERNGWKNSKGAPVENQDLWVQLIKLFREHKINFVKVKGHADNRLNNRCDELATTAIKLKKGSHTTNKEQ
jgi:ribonuclease HI